MREERLLERISRWEIGSERTNQTSADILIASILRHLRGILNTQRGTVPIDKEYGLPDFSNLAPSFSSGSTKEIQEDLMAAIERYEPRLKVVSITMVPDEADFLSLKFELTGAIRVNDRDVPVRLATVVSPDGKVEVRT
jgi:type VI secretion system protein